MNAMPYIDPGVNLTCDDPRPWDNFNLKLATAVMRREPQLIANAILDHPYIITNAWQERHLRLCAHGLGEQDRIVFAIARQLGVMDG